MTKYFNPIVGVFVYLMMGMVTSIIFSDHVSIHNIIMGEFGIWAFGWLVFWPLFIFCKFVVAAAIFSLICCLGWIVYMTLSVKT
jgi:hypothetical protein